MGVRSFDPKAFSTDIGFNTQTNNGLGWQGMNLIVNEHLQNLKCFYASSSKLLNNALKANPLRR
jgi:hypothetical protein